MNNGLKKGLVFLTVLAAITGLAGCNRQTTTTPTEPPPTTVVDETVKLFAPTISVGEDMILHISPSTDAKTAEKTTGYEVSINGSVQTLPSSQLTLQLELNAGNDVIEVRAVGGEKTQSEGVSRIMISEGQKEYIAYNHITNTLNEVLENKLNEILNQTVESMDIVSIYKQDNNLVATVRYNIDGNSTQRNLVMTDVAQNYENIFDLYQIIMENDIQSVLNYDYITTDYRGENATDSFISNGYLESDSIFAEYINSGWTATVLDQNMTSISTNLATFQTLDGFHRFSTYSTVKLEKEGQEDKYIRVNYRVSVSDEYNKSQLLDLLQNGTIEADKIILDNENITVLEKANIYQEAKERFEAKDLEMAQATTEQQLTFQSNGNSYSIVLPPESGFNM